MLKKFSNLFLQVQSLATRRLILPATLFSKKQIALIEDSFLKFWDPRFSLSKIENPKTFSTFTLGNPINLWTFYFPDEVSRKTLINSYDLCPLKIVSFDKTIIHGTLFKRKKTKAGCSRLMVMFGGNGELYKIGSSAWIFSLLDKSLADYDIAFFDPRECGRNEGFASAEGLIRDGKAVVDELLKMLSISIDLVDMCGFSLGAAIATHVKSLYPGSQGVLISNRSFQTLEKAILGIFHPLGPFFSAWFGKWALKLAEGSGWKLSPLEAWISIKSPKLVICHPKDPIIQHKASLEKGLHDIDLLQACMHIQLMQKDSKQKIKNHHVEPLKSYNDQAGKDAQELILEFLSQSFAKEKKTP